MSRILNPDENAPLELANLVSRGFTVAEARRELGFKLPDEAEEAPAPVEEAPAVEEAPKKKFPFVKKKQTPNDGL